VEGRGGAVGKRWGSEKEVRERERGLGGSREVKGRGEKPQP